MLYENESFSVSFIAVFLFCIIRKIKNRSFELVHVFTEQNRIDAQAFISRSLVIETKFRAPRT